MSNYTPEIDIRAMRALLDYDPRDGRLLWRDPMNRGRIPAGTEVGTIYPDGYKRVNIGGRMYMAHRLGYALGTGKQPPYILDHADGDRLNNALRNFRDATAAQNAHNTTTSRRNTSGVKGVYFDRYHQKYRARVMVNGKQHHLGLFKDLDEAKKAQEEARERLHGEFASMRERQYAEDELRKKKLEEDREPEDVAPPVVPIAEPAADASANLLNKVARLLRLWR